MSFRMIIVIKRQQDILNIQSVIVVNVIYNFKCKYVSLKASTCIGQLEL